MLTINSNKTNCLITTNLKLPDYVPNIQLNNSILSVKSELKYSGVIVDNKLKFGSHITHKCREVSKYIDVLPVLSMYLPTSSLISLYYSLVYPYFSYCNSVLNSTYICHLKPLIILQKRAIRVLYRAEYDAHTENLFYSRKILNSAVASSRNLAEPGKNVFKVTRYTF